MQFLLITKSTFLIIFYMVKLLRCYRIISFQLRSIYTLTNYRFAVIFRAAWRLRIWPYLEAKQSHSPCLFPLVPTSLCQIGFSSLINFIFSWNVFNGYTEATLLNCLNQNRSVFDFLLPFWCVAINVVSFAKTNLFYHSDIQGISYWIHKFLFQNSLISGSHSSYCAPLYLFLIIFTKSFTCLLSLTFSLIYNVDCYLQDGDTCLHLAASKGGTTSLAAIISAGADFNVQNRVLKL